MGLYQVCAFCQHFLRVRVRYGGRVYFQSNTKIQGTALVFTARLETCVVTS